MDDGRWGYPQMHLSLGWLLFLVALIQTTVAAPTPQELCVKSGRSMSKSTYCAPAVTVVGLPKAATSAMTMFLTEHPALRLLHGIKEACPQRRTFLGILDFLKVEDNSGKQLGAGANSSATSHMFVSGCIASYRAVSWCKPEVAPRHEQCKPMALFANYLRTISRISKKSKFILMLRDYPSLLLGHYNFWCHPFLDGTCHPGEWYTPGKHTPRTAQAFEEFVLGSDKSSISRVLGIGLMSFKRTVTNLEAMLGRDRLMLVTQEELESNTKATMDRVFAFLGLPPVDSPKFKTVVNSAANKGDDVLATGVRPGQYDNGVYLTDTARAKLAGWFKEDCEFLRDERGVQFPSC